MSGSETVALAIGPAAITGLLGAFVAVLQTRTNLRQSESITDRLRLQQAEARRHRREKVYDEFLALIYRLDAMVGGVGSISKESLDRWLLDFMNTSARIDLFGADRARAALPAVVAAINAIGSRAKQAGLGVAFEHSFAKEYAQGRADLKDAVDALTNAMREDVMADGDDEGQLPTGS